VRGSERTALVDTVDPTKMDDLLARLDEIGVDSLDCIVCNHAEQDHSGSIPVMLERFGNAVVVANRKCRGLLSALLRIPEDRFIVVGDRDTLPLGDRTLEFVIVPRVHWPETIAHLPPGGPHPLPPAISSAPTTPRAACTCRTKRRSVPQRNALPTPPRS